jgi:alpha-tubulin suppressor-like RCC1 family protein
MACALPGIDSDYAGESHAGQSGTSLGGNSPNGGSSAAQTSAGGTSEAAGASNGGSAGRTGLGGTATISGGSTTHIPTTGGAAVGAGGSNSGGSNSGGAFVTGGVQNGGASSVTAGTSSGGTTARFSGGTSGLGGSNVAGTVGATGGTVSATGGTVSATGGTVSATGGTMSATGGTSGTAPGGANSAGSGGYATTTASGGATMAGTSAMGGTQATGGYVNVAGALNSPLVPTKIATGFYTSCAVKSDGTAYCWGTEYCGALGNNSDGGMQCGMTGWWYADDYLRATLQHSPVKVQGITNAVAIARGVGNMHNCVVKSGGTVSCWGYDTYGQVGDGVTQPDVTSPLTVHNLSNVVSAVLGVDHSCALLSDSTVKCWGDNSTGAIGNGDPCSSSSCSGVGATTVLVAPGTPLDQVHGIYAGKYHTCALRTDGSVWCWGYNFHGQLGNGTLNDSPYAVRSNFPAALDCTTGGQFTCVRDVDNALWCAGYNDYGGFGIPAPDPVAPVPNPVKTLTFSSSLVALTAGVDDTCAIVSQVGGSPNVAQCWGDNYYGELGDGTRDPSLTPVTALGLTNVTEISADENHTCATMAGSVYCWGDNAGAQVGTAGNGHVVEPTKVNGL